MKKGILCFILFIVLATAVAAEQPTMLGLQGRVTDSTGVPVNNGNLRATVSTTASCEQNIVYDYTFNGVVRAGLFSVLLGNDSNLNLTYNQDYFLCTYINGEIQKNLGGSNTTKFRGGHGQIPANNLVSGTLPDDLNVTGNMNVKGNIDVNGTLSVNETRVILSSDSVSNIKDVDIKMGSQSIASYTGDFDVEVLSWQPPAGEVWEITHMTLNAPASVDTGNGINNNIDVIITNGTNEYVLYSFNVTTGDPGGINATLLFGESINQSITNISTTTLAQGIYNTHDNSGKKPLAIIHDKLYISNSNYLKINMTNGDLSARTGSWFVQGIRVS